MPAPNAATAGTTHSRSLFIGIMRAPKRTGTEASAGVWRVESSMPGKADEGRETIVRVIRADDLDEYDIGLRVLIHLEFGYIPGTGEMKGVTSAPADFFGIEYIGGILAGLGMRSQERILLLAGQKQLLVYPATEVQVFGSH